MCMICTSFRPYDDSCPYGTATGTQARVTEGADAAAGQNTAYSISLGDVFAGQISSFGDRDWVAVQLEANVTYEIDLTGVGGAELADPYLRLRDASGVQVADNDDIVPRTNLDSRIIYAPGSSGTFYLDLGAYADAGTGAYEVTVNTASDAPAGSPDELASFLTDGFWQQFGGARHAFDTSQSNEITVYLNELTADGRRLAEWALEAWEAVADLRFVEVFSVTDAMIDFDDDQSGAFANYQATGDVTTFAWVNVSTAWLQTYGTQIDDYSFQTYIHEVGHALGLGHQGGYNGSAVFGIDNDFINDSYQLSVMSYFSQDENTTVNASRAALVTPMLADILAIQDLYGAPDAQSAASAGDTVYGRGHTQTGYMQLLMDAVHNGQDPANHYGDQAFALTIYDAGGTDLFDFSDDPADQTIDMRAQGISDIYGLTGNLVIARDTLIENLNAGSGSDYVLGNGIANQIDGGAGSDLLVGGSGSDSLFGGFGDDVLNGDDVDVGFDPVSAQVFRLYQATLDRAPDAAGHRGWTETLRDGQASLLQVIEGFMGSPEFQGRYGATDTTEFVTLMYENVLGRAPDPAGLQAWRDQLDSGALSRAEVVFGFSESQEFMGNTAAGALEFSQAGYRANWADEVFRLYQATLDRAPDPGGLLAWVGELAGGRPYLEVVSGFVNSSEFQGRYGATDNAEFVTLMYENVLGRAPDPAGLQGWRGLLDDGTLSREEVVRGFAESAEFRDNTGPDLSAWMRATFPGDRLEGGGGANAVFGGFGADSFVFDAGDGGTHEVVDLEAWDWVILDGFSYADAGAVLADLTRQGTDLLLADSGVTITFLDTDIADITTDIFQII
ncbi:DUF4214 domain-containing protein [Rhodophyticola porphyridii]|uniref:DUF4214 domain-containing protein n=1 Tax=Rhodophyticola porphyridii TaxID=1852017 RepID=A0A3L9Y449_9RHOB|nr:DUF4214 domain-containing protein [Rhodophyticola porphyridii]RMA43519.1 DUF4214 domain-containing protein [Rhodophyticola porphyridii]